jgi:hypothetical protein
MYVFNNGDPTLKEIKSLLYKKMLSFAIKINDFKRDP